jgi:hypothetical protein
MKLRVIVQWDSIHRNLMSSLYMPAVEGVPKGQRRRILEADPPVEFVPAAPDHLYFKFLVRTYEETVLQFYT